MTGIIAEFKPLHSGHKYLIDEAKRGGPVVCVISGNFVQRGDTAIFEKRVRAEMALKCGADLVIELPVCYSMSTAQNFAFGSISLLSAIGCDNIIFGSESGKIQPLIESSEILCSQEFSKKLSTHLESGITFAKARQMAAEECGVPKGVLKGANNNLGIEYILAAKTINPKIKFKTIKRLGAMHDSTTLDDSYISASLIRQKIKENDFSSFEKYIPTEIWEIFKNCNYSDITKIENAILAVLRTKTSEDLSFLPDLSEGLENKLFSQIKVALNLEQLYNDMKVKRYTHARIRRLVLSAFLGLDNHIFLKTPPYLRVLGFNKTGEEILRKQKINSPIPIILRANEIEKLGTDAQYVFDAECRATDLYGLSLNKPICCGLEMTAPLIKL